MIKINLLSSDKRRRAESSLALDKKISSPGFRLLFMSVSVFALLIAISTWTLLKTRGDKEQAENQLAEQQKIAKKLEAITKEQKELEQKIKNVENRISAIRKLRSSQRGPRALLEAIRDRVGRNVYLTSVVQKGSQLTIDGNSVSEPSITQFLRSLEFSSGLFTGLTIDITRDGGIQSKPSSLMRFKIGCIYNSEKADPPDSSEALTSKASGSSISSVVPIRVSER